MQPLSLVEVNFRDPVRAEQRDATGVLQTPDHTKVQNSLTSFPANPMLVRPLPEAQTSSKPTVDKRGPLAGQRLEAKLRVTSQSTRGRSGS